MIWTAVAGGESFEVIRPQVDETWRHVKTNNDCRVYNVGSGFVYLTSPEWKIRNQMWPTSEFLRYFDPPAR